MKRKGLFILCCAVLHFAAMTLAVLISIRYGMNIDGPGTHLGHIATRVSQVLLFPGYNIIERCGIVYLGRWGDLLMVLNSVLWAVCIYFLVTFLQGRRAKPSKA